MALVRDSKGTWLQVLCNGQHDDSMLENHIENFLQVPHPPLSAELREYRKSVADQLEADKKLGDGDWNSKPLYPSLPNDLRIDFDIVECKLDLCTVSSACTKHSPTHSWKLPIMRKHLLDKFSELKQFANKGALAECIYTDVVTEELLFRALVDSMTYTDNREIFVENSNGKRVTIELTFADSKLRTNYPYPEFYVAGLLGNMHAINAFLLYIGYKLLSYLQQTCDLNTLLELEVLQQKVVQFVEGLVLNHNNKLKLKSLL